MVNEENIKQVNDEKQSDLNDETVHERVDEESASERGSCDEKSDCGCDCDSEKNESQVSEDAKPEDDKDIDCDSDSSDEMTGKYVRLMAEFQNYKKRVSKEKDDLRVYANESLVVSLLEVIDNFERALEHESTDEGYVTGMQMIFKQIVETLKKSGLEEIEALGADFDPSFHNAVMTGDDPEFDSGKVTMVMQKGYTLNGKVIRASMVKVNN